jgi:hypothetical protein
VLLEEEELVCPRSRELTGRNKTAISRKRTLLAASSFTEKHLTNLEKLSEYAEILYTDMLTPPPIGPKIEWLDANIDAPKPFFG